MPKPWRIGGCVVWDIRKIHVSLGNLDDGEVDDWE